MAEKEVITLRANILGGMNEYVRHGCINEEQLALWDAYGIPDGCDEEMLMEIAEDANDFKEVAYWFSCIIRMGVMF